MITFIVSSEICIQQKYSLPQIILFHVDWNDWWKYETLFGVYYFDIDGNSHKLGGIKIGQLSMQEGQKTPNIPQEFTELPPHFFSLGQDVDYYDNIKNLGDNIRENIHKSLNDIAFDENIFESVISEKVTSDSLMRYVSKSSIKGQFRRLSLGDATLTDYHFEYSPYSGRSGIPPIQLKFNVEPESNPPTNVHVIIGKNGVGKTHLLHNMAQSLLEERAIRFGKFSSSHGLRASEIFANLVLVSFSAFDSFELPSERKNKTLGISYSNIGLRAESTKSERIFTTKSPTKLKNEFARSAYLCKIGGKMRRLKKALQFLETDTIFREADIKNSLEKNEQKEFEVNAGNIFNELSSGHKIVLLTITRIVETLEEKSLVLIDEPETYLHPPLLSAFLRALSELLTTRNAVAIIATHSPVVLQEVPKSCCWKLRRAGQHFEAERLEIESFGENVGLLTQEVFGLEVTNSGFHSLLKKSVDSKRSYQNVLSDFENQLGFEARAIIRGLLAK